MKYDISNYLNEKKNQQISTWVLMQIIKSKSDLNTRNIHEQVYLTTIYEEINCILYSLENMLKQQNLLLKCCIKLISRVFLVLQNF